MKRIIGVLTTAMLSIVVFASTALADSHTYPPGGDVAGSGGGGTGGGTAFTGGDVSIAFVATLALLAVGVSAMVVARRRAARIAG